MLEKARVGFKKNNKPQLTHLRAYSSRAYMMTKKAQLKEKHKWKLNPRAYISYLINYDSINIFKVWIPYKDIIISTHDVIFDEHIFFDEKFDDLSQQIINEINSLITKI